MIAAIPIFLFILLIVFLGLFMVKQQTSYIIERFGKFSSIRFAGLQFKIPFVDRIAARLSLRIQQLDVVVETKTNDDVFVQLKISVQYQILKDKVYDAYYKLQNPHEQLTAYIFDLVRAEIPKMILDDVFEKKDDIAFAVKRDLKEAIDLVEKGLLKCLWFGKITTIQTHLLKKYLFLGH